ncbi:uncharacterized protein LOC107417366 [Ziziphus jujuba]|uniref:Uncharacterized protein LOC107417366 n=1 Tax=Ziziphus jujuba TaxID=326968 RepID=A0A6P3ZPY2_ZIZJJ|nr:uncharacterized protein LOC107417366 [Ziziphus jujuba]
MATTRLLRSSKPLNFPSSSSSPPSSSQATMVRCLNNGEKRVVGGSCSSTGHHDHDHQHLYHHQRNQTVAVKASLSTSENVMTASKPKEVQIGGILEYLVSVILNANHAVLVFLRNTFRQKSLKHRLQMAIEKMIIDCRFFTLFAVGGSLIGSVLCFLEGCFTILESYFRYFHALSEKSDQGHVVELLIEAIDMFLVGTAMLMFGFGLYAMFVGSNIIKEKGSTLSGSNLFGLFYMKMVPAWVEMQTVSQAKSKIGHAMMMILQVGVLQKFKSIPLVTGLDLACFAGAVFLSSACIFVLSRISYSSTDGY